MFRKKIDPEQKKILDEGNINLEIKFKSPELLLKNALNTLENFLKAIIEIHELLKYISTHINSNEKKVIDLIANKMKQIITSITEGNFLKHSTRFIELIPNAYYEENEIDKIIDQLDILILLTQELKEAKPLRVFQVLEKLFIDFHDKINDTAFPISRYVPPKFIGEMKP